MRKAVREDLTVTSQKDPKDLTREQLSKIPLMDVLWCKEVECTSITIVPTKKIHDSGYRIMDFVLEFKDPLLPLKRLDGSADVVHINGIGGLGYKWIDKPEEERDRVDAVAWQFDCLPKSGCIRLFILSSQPIIVGPRLSSVEIWKRPKGMQTGKSAD